MNATVDTAMDDAVTWSAIHATYQETLTLLSESETRIKDRRQKPCRMVAASDRVFVIQHEMRITARLASAMAWLMMQRAVEEGEVAHDDQIVVDLDPFDEANCCLEQRAEDDHRLCEGLKDLLQRSYDVYCRVIAMDTALRSDQMVMQ